MLGKHIPAILSYPAHYLFLPLIFALGVGLLAGIYPAVLLSSLKSVDSLKGKLKSVKENVWLRKALVGFQFCIALIVLIGAIIISKQVELFFSKDLGYNKDLVISAQAPRDWSAKGVQRMEALRNEFATMPEVKSVTLSYEYPTAITPETFVCIRLLPIQQKPLPLSCFIPTNIIQMFTVSRLRQEHI